MEVGGALAAVSLDAVLIGNAGAALQGATVTTLDFDFLFRRTPRNLAKLKQFATRLGATVLRPYYPVSDLFRVVRDDGLQVDFMGTIHGVRSYEGVRARATMVDVAGVAIAVASLGDIIKSKKAAVVPRIWPSFTCWSGRMRDRKPRKPARDRKARLDALARESVRALDDAIERWQALPPGRRTHFLRVRRPLTAGSCL